MHNSPAQEAPGYYTLRVSLIAARQSTTPVAANPVTTPVPTGSRITCCWLLVLWGPYHVPALVIREAIAVRRIIKQKFN
jgi:hypothetical protein